MRIAAALIAALVLSGCPLDTRPTLPHTVTVTVEVPAKLPAWAVDPLPLDPPADGTVRAIVTSDQARGATVQYANCRSALLVAKQAGKRVDIKECAK